MRVLQLIFIAVLAPAGLLVLLELGLRIGGYGHSAQVLLKKSLRGQTFYVTNKHFFQQFFSSRVDVAASHNEVPIPAAKPEGAYRIFVLGSSAAHGTPPDQAFNFGRVVETMLRARYPSVQFEVWDVAYPCITSSVVWAVAKACASLHPDLFVVYTGNNEVNGPFGAVVSGTKHLSWTLPIIRGTTLLRDLRMAQLFTGHARSLWLLQPSAIDPVQTDDDPRLLAAYDRYRTNLGDICRFARRAGAGTILCTVGCNLRDWSPGASVHQRALSEEDRTRWEAAYQEANAARNAGNAADAARSYEAAAAIDDTYADLQFRLGACYWQLGEYERAKEYFVQAWRQDRFYARIAPHFNDIVAEVAQANADRGVHFLDATRVLAEPSPHGVPGREIFYDNVHMTFMGNYVLGASLFDAVDALLPDLLKQQAVEAPRLTQAECEGGLGLSPAVLMGHYQQILNLNSDFFHQDMDALERARTELEKQITAGTLRPTAEGYRRALDLHGSDWLLRSRYVRALYDLCEFPTGLVQADLMVAEFPLRREAHSLRGMLLAKLGRSEEAETEFRTTLDLYPDDRTACHEWGSLLETRQDFQGAQALYESFLRENPDDQWTVCRKAKVMAKVGNVEAAEQLCERLIEKDPKFPDAYSTLDEVLRERDDPAVRIARWQEIATQHPDVDRPAKYLAGALQESGDLEGAVRAYSQAVERNPGDASTYMDLGRVYLTQGDAQAAVDTVRKALHANPDAYPAHALLFEAFLRLGDQAPARTEMDLARQLGQAINAGLLEEWTRQGGVAPQ